MYVIEYVTEIVLSVGFYNLWRACSITVRGTAVISTENTRIHALSSIHYLHMPQRLCFLLTGKILI